MVEVKINQNNYRYNGSEIKKPVVLEPRRYKLIKNNVEFIEDEKHRSKN